jgi:peptidyl-prolyl cis-trans isomerase SurA
MKIGLLALTTTLLFSLVAIGQEKNEITLLTINGNSISASEFEWAFSKNNSGSSKSSIDEYLTLYINFQLKVTAAKDAGLDKTSAFTKELEGYKRQLSRNYLTDQKAKEELLVRAYERYKEEINVFHVLVKCAPDAVPADTLEAWEKARKIRERLRLGEPFESVARGASDDPYVTINGGDLGYITVFQTPLSFENAIYSMKPGGLSPPVRTAGGYHIIKVQDRRESRGKIRVAHIMKSLPQGAESELAFETKMQIDSLYQLLLDGADFLTIAAENSDDISTASNGGELPPFGAGEMIKEFSENAFSLLRNGDISKPLKTIYGWHIIKRLEKIPLLPFDQAKPLLESKLSQSYLLSLSRKSFTEKLKKEYNYQTNQEVLEWFYSIADSSFRSGNYQLENKHIPTDNLYTFSNTKCSAKNFLEYIRLKGTQSSTVDSIEYINTLLNLKSYEDLVRYEESILEYKYPEYRYLLNEFYNGILLFEISDSLIWNKGLEDSDMMKKYYEGRKGEFTTPSIASGTIYSLDSRLGKKRTSRLIKTIKKNSEKKGGQELIYKSAISGGDTLIQVEKGSWEKGENAILDLSDWSEGFHLITQNGNKYLVEFTSISEADHLPFEEVRDSLVDDYLKYLEIEWIKQLRSTYSVIIDEKVLNSIKNRVKQ